MILPLYAFNNVCCLAPHCVCNIKLTNSLFCLRLVWTDVTNLKAYADVKLREDSN